jgi:glucose-6-phosphate 1-epimerase
VYKAAPGEYQVRWTGGGVYIKTTGFPDVVVWNPQKEIGSKMADMEDGGWWVSIYSIFLDFFPPPVGCRVQVIDGVPGLFFFFSFCRERYVCVEPGLVSAWNTLAPGETWVGTQVFRPL